MHAKEVHSIKIVYFLLPPFWNCSVFFSDNNSSQCYWAPTICRAQGQALYVPIVFNQQACQVGILSFQSWTNCISRRLALQVADVTRIWTYILYSLPLDSIFLVSYFSPGLFLFLGLCLSSLASCLPVFPCSCICCCLYLSHCVSA